MNTEEILKTAHIQLDHANFRVHVKDASVFPFERMEEEKPDYVLWVSRSNDSTQRETSLIVSVIDGYDLEELADWIRSYEND